MSQLNYMHTKREPGEMTGGRERRKEGRERGREEGREKVKEWEKREDCIYY